MPNFKLLGNLAFHFSIIHVFFAMFVWTIFSHKEYKATCMTAGPTGVQC